MNIFNTSVRAAIWGCCFLLFSCCDDADLKLKLPIMAWLPYSAEQEIKFKSQAGDTISFLATTQEFNEKGNDKACGTYNIQTIQTTLTSPSDSTVKTVISVSHEVVVGIKVYNPVNQRSNLNIKFNTVSELFISDDFRDKYFLEAQMDGKTYQQVLHVYGDRRTGNLLFADILYAKNIGLIGFKTFDDKWYYLL
ncbi:hypothetical protein [Adhaeribacter aerolatus]|uniref:hypothetical protein n=1 Tax=Adhaeribacter aerolatus TaxID=670289 RepID=UPI0011BF4CAD|nr:hypothetical protein [Adhaeribacter aerolatus]